MSLSDYFDNKREKSSAIDYAKQIVTELKNWRAEKEIAEVKWLWELIQNARDVAVSYNKKNFNVTFTLNDDHLLFEHDAGPFSPDDIYNLINSRSDKFLEPEKLVGEFGKGFLVSHVLSPQVIIRGRVQNETGDINRTFEVILDRKIQADDISSIEYISKNIVDCCVQIEAPGPKIKPALTQYKYLIDREGYNVASRGLQSIRNVIPFILAFTEPNINIKIIQKNSESNHQITNSKSICSNHDSIDLLTINNSKTNQNSYLLVVSSSDSDVKISIPYIEEKNSLKTLDDIPRLFKMQPLTKTKDLNVPIIINAPFEVSEDRSDLLYSEENGDKFRIILKTTSGLIKKLCKYVLDADIQNREILFKIGASKERTWKNEVQKEIWGQVFSFLVRDMAEMKICEILIDEKTEKSELIEPKFVSFPSPQVGNYPFDDDKFLLGIWNLSHLIKKKVPIKKIINKWNEIRSYWNTFNINVGTDQKLEDIVIEIENMKKLENLKQILTLETDDASLTYLNYLYRVCHRYTNKMGQIPSFFKYSIYCNQLGHFLKPEELNIDDGIPDKIKKFSEGIMPYLLNSLLNKKLVKSEEDKKYFNRLGMKVIDEEKSIECLYDEIIRIWNRLDHYDEINSNLFKACTALFEKWLLCSENFDNININFPLNRLPFLCKDNGLRKKDQFYFIPCELFLDEEIIKYLYIWPSYIVLSNTYEQDVENVLLLKERLIIAKIIRPNIIYKDDVVLYTDDMKKYSKKSIRTGIKYKIKTQISKIVALKNMLENNQKIKDPNMTKGIINFILEYVVPNDDSWKEQKITAKRDYAPGEDTELRDNERNFEVRLCEWLNELKQFEWVIKQEKDEDGKLMAEGHKPEKDSLVAYVKSLDPKILSNEEAQEFLKIFNFVPLEMTAWLISGGDETIVVDGLKQVQLLADSRGISAMELFSEITSEVVERSRRAEITRRNQKFGLIMEEMARSLFDELKLAEYGFVTVPRWKGCDFEAYLHNEAIIEYDLGSLSISIKESDERSILAHFYVEVKATRIGAVRMTLAQAEQAVDNIDEYLLCVIDAKEVEWYTEVLEANHLSEEDVQKLSGIIKPHVYINDIGRYLMKIITDLRKAKDESEDIGVDYSASFTVPTKIWKIEGLKIQDWFISILKEKGVPL